MNLIILTTDTSHHRYFLQKISKKFKIDAIFFETTSIQPKHNTFANFHKFEKKYEEDNFFNEVQNSIPSVPSHFYSNINDDEAILKLKSYNADIGIVFGTRKLQQNIISCFSNILMNVHRGIIQSYRGLDSDLWAIYNKDFKNIGVTIHKVDKDIDTGKIISQERMQINKDTELFHIRYLTTIMATSMIARILSEIINNNNLTLRENKGSNYYSFMDSEKKRIVESIFKNHKRSIR